MKKYLVFHVCLIESYKRSNDAMEPPPPILQDNVEEYKVEQDLNSKVTRGKLRCKVV